MNNNKLFTAYNEHNHTVTWDNAQYILIHSADALEALEEWGNTDGYNSEWMDAIRYISAEPGTIYKFSESKSRFEPIGNIMTFWNMVDDWKGAQ